MAEVQMKFSFVIPYRNRETDRVARCLASLQAQSFSDFEIVFIDYGSDAPINAQIGTLCNQFDKVRYLYYDTRGWFWSRSHAVNLGIVNAKGDTVVVVDIDLIYSPVFLARLDQLNNQSGAAKEFYHYQCYYLPESFRAYDQLDFVHSRPYETSTFQGSGGLVAVPRQAFAEAGFFDEYFRVWGVEDMDMTERLQQAGYVRRTVPVTEAASFHQWHPKAYRSNAAPHSWYDAMETHWQARKARGNAQGQLQCSFPPLERLAVASLESPNHWLFQFRFPLLSSFNRFSAAFLALAPGQGLAVRQSFEAIPEAAPTKLAQALGKVNGWLAKTPFSYRLTEIRTFETDLIHFRDVRDFLFYFIAENQAFIVDYRFEQSPTGELNILIIKK